MNLVIALLHRHMNKKYKDVHTTIYGEFASYLVYLSQAENEEVLIWDFIKRFLSRSDLHIIENDATLPTGNTTRAKSWFSLVY